MITITSLIKSARLKWSTNIKIRYSFPNLYVFVVSDDFLEFDLDRRRSNICSALQINEDDLDSLEALAFVKVVAVTNTELEHQYKFINSRSRSDHWLPLFDPINWEFNSTQAPFSTDRRTNGVNTPLQKVLHFYGYKGGQGRSTVLAMIAKSLADDGYNVLVLDADIEAPSMDSLFNVSTEALESTLMGLSGWSDAIEPIPAVYVGKSRVDLISCRPRSTEFDMDFAAFALRTSLDPSTLRLAMERLQNYLLSTKYDVILVDHRTGLSSAVIPIISTLRGTAVIFARPDKMVSAGFERHLVDTLLSFDTILPGLFVGFSLDPTDKEESYRRRPEEARFIERMLLSLGAALEKNSPDNEAIDPTFLEQYWVTWFHDSALLTAKLPNLENLAKENIDSIYQIRQLTALEGVNPVTHPIALTRSGSTDEGSFILTPDVARLFNSQSPYIYITGRKGTGKTRLVRELTLRSLGEPMLVAADFKAGGLTSNSIAFDLIMKSVDYDYDRFWWILLYYAVTNTGDLQEYIENNESNNIKIKTQSFNSLEVVNMIVSLKRSRVFLIDGLETSVPAANLRKFVESAFRFISSVQYSRQLTGLLTIRMFLRSDLAKVAAQNVEQQTEGRALDLHWDRRSILNFALVRMATLPLFADNFSEAIEKISSLHTRLVRGEVQEETCEEILLLVFPTSLERNRIRTTTFFATYFSDAGGDNASTAGFYPRLFDAFLRKLNEDSRQLREKVGTDDRLLSGFVLSSFDQASAEFIAEVQQELDTLLEFSVSPDENRRLVTKFIESFLGQQTPFRLDALVQDLELKSGIAAEPVRKALINMKGLGIFEDRPGYPGYWRAGRVYKAGLKMLYVRARSAQ